jgi:hypothetical protein
MSPSFSAVCAIWNSSAAFPLISSSPGITKSGFFPGLKTMDAPTDSGKANAAATKTKSVRMTNCMGCGRVIDLSAQSSSSGRNLRSAEARILIAKCQSDTFSKDPRLINLSFHFI